MPPVQTIAVFGDSITYGKCDPQGGWVQRLRTMLEGNRQPPWIRPVVYNLGISGETSVEMLARFSSEYNARFDVGDLTGIIFATGINDSLYLSNVQRQHTTLPQFEESLRSLIGLAKAKTSFVMCVGLTRVIESQTQPIPWHSTKHYRNAEITQYDSVLESVADECGVPYLSLRNIPWDATFLAEGLHPNAAGHERIASFVFQKLSGFGWVS